jgi:hypothetical protein
MKQFITLIIVALISWVGAQSQNSTEPPTTVVETMYLLPKRGMDDKFEAAVKAHDVKFHPEGPYVAGLRKVEYGEKAGWYVWIYGPTDYASIDKRPDKEGGHADDWEKMLIRWLINTGQPIYGTITQLFPSDMIFLKNQNTMKSGRLI